MNKLELIWNGWRSTYLNGSDGAPAGDGSVFTRILNAGLSDVDANIVHRGDTCFAIMNAFPYGVGHMMVLPMREVPDLELLTPAEAAEMWATVTDAVAAVKTAYRPGGVNVGVNLGASAGGSISEHLHVHVLPRWTGDVNFITAVANARILPEPLDESARKIRDAWPIGSDGRARRAADPLR